MKMLRVSLALVAVAAAVAAMFTSSLTVRAQTAARFEYVRVTPSVERFRTAPNSVQARIGYQACIATISEWTCRQFHPPDASTAPLRMTLATLGNEGWELVSVVNEEPSTSNLLTYLFKRQVR